ncbi:MAG: MaoC/PaaZ C-terminal domain-containing protein [Oscillospiraceae bacterium]
MYFEELQVGMKVRTEAVKIEKEEMIAFSQKYDNVPLHTNEEYAKTTPFGQIISAGMMSFLVVWAKYLEQDFFGGELLAGTSQKVEWFKPVFAEDTLSGIAEITKLTERNPKNGLAELTIKVYNQQEELVLTGITECIVKKKQA